MSVINRGSSDRLVPEGHVLRMTASFLRLPEAQCAVPDRCEPRACQRCGRPVHYDPEASIPLLGPEWIVCDICLEAVLG